MKNQINVLMISAFLVVVALSMVMIAPMAHAQNLGQMGYFTSGSKTGAKSGSVTQVIRMNNAKELNLILTASGGNFGNKYMIVQTSLDNSVFKTVDNISLTTTVTKGIGYSSAAKATTVPVNPAAFPFVKVFTSAGVINVTETLQWSGIR